MEERARIKTFEAALNTGEPFEYETTEWVCKEYTVPYNNTQCKDCVKTCHQDCAFGNDDGKRHCCMMSSSSGLCSSCGCHWLKHINSKKVYEVVPRTVTKTNLDLKRKYEVTNSSKTAAEQALDGVTEEINEYQLRNLELHMQI